MLRRLHAHQPDSFAFTPANLKWAEAQMTKFPQGRQASAIIPLLWRAQEQEGWLSRPAIEHVAAMLDLAYIRALEVATFYFMFQLAPVGSVAHLQICGTTSCMICGAEDLIAVCRNKIAPSAHQLSADGKFSWEEVECLGACANAPMAQIGKDYYEDLTAARLGEIIDEMAAGQVPLPGPQNGRYAAEPLSGLTSLKDYAKGRPEHNASVAAAMALGDTIKRIDGSEVRLTTPWIARPASTKGQDAPEPTPGQGHPADETGITVQQAPELEKGRPKHSGPQSANTRATQPAALKAARDGNPDDLKRIKGVGPKLEKQLHSLGFYHYDQVAAWTSDEAAWVDDNLEGFKGRATRDAWVDQARALSDRSGATNPRKTKR